MSDPYRGDAPALTPVGWFIANLHGLLGHDKTAAFLGQPIGDRSDCLICTYERERTPESKQAVYEALGGPL